MGLLYVLGGAAKARQRALQDYQASGKARVFAGDAGASERKGGGLLERGL